MIALILGLILLGLILMATVLVLCMVIAGVTNEKMPQDDLTSINIASSDSNAPRTNRPQPPTVLVSGLNQGRRL